MRNSLSSNQHSVAQLQELMTAQPMTIEVHAAIMKERVEARRLVENAREEALMRRSAFDDSNQRSA